jgi:hypothetical protein
VRQEFLEIFRHKNSCSPPDNSAGRCFSPIAEPKISENFGGAFCRLGQFQTADHLRQHDGR